MTKYTAARVATVLLGSLLVVSGRVGDIQYGGLCSPNLWVITMADPLGFVLRPLGVFRLELDLTCPLGFVQRSLAARAWLPQWPSVVLAVITVLILGRIFCAWICPTVVMRRVFGREGGAAPRRQAAPSRSAWEAYSPYAVLGGVLLASYVFRFPVFCLFCPIGLFFASVYAALRAVSPGWVGIELVLFPAMLVAELWLLKSWCTSICPLGALLSIAGNLNRFLLPTVRKDGCLTSKGVDCHVCERACPEGIVVAELGSTYAPNSCTKCLLCIEKCPAKSIDVAVVR